MGMIESLRRNIIIRLEETLGVQFLGWGFSGVAGMQREKEELVRQSAEEERRTREHLNARGLEGFLDSGVVKGGQARIESNEFPGTYVVVEGGGLIEGRFYPGEPVTRPPTAEK